MVHVSGAFPDAVLCWPKVMRSLEKVWVESRARGKAFPRESGAKWCTAHTKSYSVKS